MVTSKPLGLAETNVSLFVGGHCCELYKGIELIKVCGELQGVFCLVDGKGVIQIPKPGPAGFGGSAAGSGFKVQNNRLATKWLI